MTSPAPSPVAPAETLRLAPGVTREFLHHHRVCPSRVSESGGLVVITAPDANLDAIGELSLAYARTVSVEQQSADEVARAIERLAAGGSRSEAAIELDVRRDPDSELLGTDVRELANKPPVVRYVNLLVADAYEARASDIHLDGASGETLDVRYRLDGVLQSAPAPAIGLAPAVISRIKLLAEMDTAERRRPQDGRVRVRLASRELDLRVSTVPTLHGESVVIRLLDQGGRPVALDELGMPPDVLDGFARLAAMPHGMVIATGPTGSGKTTTLYAALARRSVRAEKILTVEDPVEYELPGVTQVPVHRQAGMTMSSALRSILRQDPDVLMVGEMRDSETAELATQAAMTGHLVFTTLHTTDSVGSIPRLLDLGVPDFLLASTLEGILAQRLARRTCTECQEEYLPPAQQLAWLVGSPLHTRRFVRGVGCARCRHTGYRGRVGLFELLVMSDELKHALARSVRGPEFESLARAQGMRTMREDGWTKVQSGHTTVEEVLRVLGH